MRRRSRYRSSSPPEQSLAVSTNLAPAQSRGISTNPACSERLTPFTSAQSCRRRPCRLSHAYLCGVLLSSPQIQIQAIHPASRSVVAEQRIQPPVAEQMVLSQASSQFSRKMLALPLEERMRILFTEVSEVNQFGALKHLAPTYSEEEILKVLPKYACLVHGVWVCKSSLLFGDVNASKRDTLLLELSKNDFIPAIVVDKIVRLGDPSRKKILLPLCKRSADFGNYTLISPADESFIKRYPCVVKEQNDAWSALEKSILDPQNMNIPAKHHHSNASKGRDGPAQELDYNWHSVLDHVFTNRKVRSLQAIVREIGVLARDASDAAMSSAANYCLSISPEQLNTFILQVAVPVHGAYVAKTSIESSPGNLLIRLLKEKEPHATLLKKEIYETAEAQNVAIDKKEFQKILTEICTNLGGGKLRLKSGDYTTMEGIGAGMTNRQRNNGLTTRCCLSSLVTS